MVALQHWPLEEIRDMKLLTASLDTSAIRAAITKILSFGKRQMIERERRRAAIPPLDVEGSKLNVERSPIP